MKIMYWGDSLGNGVPQAMSAALGGVPISDGHQGGDSAAQVLARFKSGKGSGGWAIGPGTGNLNVIRCGHPELMMGQVDSAKASITEMVRLSADALVCELGQRSTVALGSDATSARRRKDRAAFNAWMSTTFGERYVSLQSELIARARSELVGKLTQRDLEGMLQGMLPDVLATDTAQDGHMEPLAQKWAGEILAVHARRRQWKPDGSVPEPTPNPPPAPTPTPSPVRIPAWLQRLLDRLRGRL